MIFLRSLAFNLWFFGLTLVLGVYGVALRWLAPERVLDLAMVWARLVLGGARVLCGISIEVTGREYLPAHGPALIASQHQSAFDTLVWLLLVPRACYVLKQELTRIPLFGPLLRPGRQIVVDRGAGSTALRGLLRAGQRARDEARQIVIFPEGTRTAPGQLGPIQPGVVALARQTGLPVIPVATNSGQRWGKRAFHKRPGPIRIAIQPPLPFDLDRTTLMERLQQSWHAAKLTE
jgi:1-acyl-sn-glycerol-3-phosphate acyltransferase